MKTRSKFIKVKCKDCENQQVIFNKVSNDVECRICGRTLAIPTGGLAELKSKVVEEVD
ncbi:30S ribosomal protein S27e [Methanonatronarchaeum sp. AMET-Sl]|uniref:30S ribosomal protein S27e n=1 Tax=Methanonatronarchaeum sp. AMET-Sl TaxID=3037654 RepID=UPI00244DF485|nr:30S ribosomal protein S27e [Methanonatronarchaeum sp. AMET-Sl]WGI17106.1 30S ribosomal protein S27e [Methanonatronarchaeum sp. AMET-Sl]